MRTTMGLPASAPSGRSCTRTGEGSFASGTRKRTAFLSTFTGHCERT
ncbi:hypothetical protein [Corallococcus sp. 4LFB]